MIRAQRLAKFKARNRLDRVAVRRYLNGEAQMVPVYHELARKPWRLAA